MSRAQQLVDRITYYLNTGGLFNPELADHQAVRLLLIECRDELELIWRRPNNETDARN